MEDSRLAYLFGRYIGKTTTAEEAEELFKLMADAKNEPEVYQLIATAWDSFEPVQTVFSEEQSKALLQRIMATENNAKVIKMPTEKQKPSWWRIAVAAAVLLIMGTAAYLFIAKTKYTPQSEAERLKYDVPPGGNKAVLTLGNGSTIVLDSANNGLLAQQGNMKIIKLSNGELAYSANGETAIEIYYNTMRTPRGGQYELTLPDGSKVWLNASSSIRYPTVFTGSRREVEIGGEAYFEVAKNAAMPFVVKINNDAEVEVLGTHFNINAYDDERVIKTTLLEGSVKISSLSTANHLPPTILKPGEQAQIEAGQLQVVKDADTEEAMAWHNGLFNLKSIGIEALMRQINRWYDIEVIYDGKIPEGHFSGMVGRDTNLSSVLKILELNGVNYRLENKKITIYPGE